jgi:hypothetical protein
MVHQVQLYAGETSSSRSKRPTRLSRGRGGTSSVRLVNSSSNGIQTSDAQHSVAAQLACGLCGVLFIGDSTKYGLGHGLGRAKNARKTASVSPDRDLKSLRETSLPASVPSSQTQNHLWQPFLCVFRLGDGTRGTETNVPSNSQI